MFGKRPEQSPAAAHNSRSVQAQPGVVLPFGDERAYLDWAKRKTMLLRGGTKATATINSISDVGMLGERFIRVVAVRLEPTIGQPFDTSAFVVESGSTSPLPIGGTVSAFFDPADLTMVAFVIAPSSVAASPSRPTPRWRVPARCTQCGAPVDIAVASLEDDPKCGFCFAPLAVEPIA